MLLTGTPNIYFFEYVKATTAVGDNLRISEGRTSLAVRARAARSQRIMMTSLEVYVWE